MVSAFCSTLFVRVCLVFLRRFGLFLFCCLLFRCDCLVLIAPWDVWALVVCACRLLCGFGFWVTKASLLWLGCLVGSCGLRLVWSVSLCFVLDSECCSFALFVHAFTG